MRGKIRDKLGGKGWALSYKAQITGTHAHMDLGQGVNPRIRDSTPTWGGGA